jgi:hypothetical protein
LGETKEEAEEPRAWLTGQDERGGAKDLEPPLSLLSVWMVGDGKILMNKRVGEEITQMNDQAGVLLLWFIICSGGVVYSKSHWVFL